MITHEQLQQFKADVATDITDKTSKKSVTRLNIATKLDRLADFVYGIASPNSLISVGAINVSDNEVVVYGPVAWRINGLFYEKTGPSVFAIEFCSFGNTRIDLIYGDQEGAIGIVTGEESSGSAVPPLLPENTVAVTYVYVYADAIDQPEPDLDPDDFVSKQFLDGALLDYVQLTPDGPQVGNIDIDGNIRSTGGVTVGEDGMTTDYLSSGILATDTEFYLRTLENEGPTFSFDLMGGEIVRLMDNKKVLFEGDIDPNQFILASPQGFAQEDYIYLKHNDFVTSFWAYGLVEQHGSKIGFGDQYNVVINSLGTDGGLHIMVSNTDIATFDLDEDIRFFKKLYAGEGLLSMGGDGSATSLKGDVWSIVDVYGGQISNAIELKTSRIKFVNYDYGDMFYMQRDNYYYNIFRSDDNATVMWDRGDQDKAGNLNLTDGDLYLSGLNKRVIFGDEDDLTYMGYFKPASKTYYNAPFYHSFEIAGDQKLAIGDSSSIFRHSLTVDGSLTVESIQRAADQKEVLWEGDAVDLENDQTVYGVKTFINGVNFNGNISVSNHINVTDNNSGASSRFGGGFLTMDNAVGTGYLRADNLVGGNHTLQLPNGNGTIARVEDLAGYVRLDPGEKQYGDINIDGSIQLAYSGAAGFVLDEHYIYIDLGNVNSGQGQANLRFFNDDEGYSQVQFFTAHASGQKGLDWIGDSSTSGIVVKEQVSGRGMEYGSDIDWQNAGAQTMMPKKYIDGLLVNAARLITVTAEETGPALQRDELIGAASVELIVNLGTLLLGPFSFDPSTGTVMIEVVAGDVMTIIYK